MPYIKLETNAPIPEIIAGELLIALSDAVTGPTGKPESAMQASMQGGLRMLMAKSEEPTAFVQVKGIAFPEAKAADVSAAVCALLTEKLGVPGKRIYITFDSYERSMWGVDGRTF